MENNQQKEIQDSKKEDEQFTLVNVILIFLKYKKHILIISGISCLIAIILYFFVFDLIFVSNASIKSASKSSGLLGSLEGSIPDIGGLDDLGIGGGKSAKELAFYVEILNSRRCIESVINKFGLMQREEIKFMEDAIKMFKSDKMLIEQEKVAGILYVSIFDKDPVMAKNILSYLLDQLDKINIELNIANAKNNRAFIETRYFQAKEDLSKAEDSLKSYQVIYGVAPDLQVKASAQAEFTLEAELKTEEVKLDVLRKLLGSGENEIKTQETKISSLRNKISEIQNSTDLNSFLKLGNSPQIVLSYLRLQREVEIQSKIVSFLLPLYEQAKIEEKKETPTIMLLDSPQISEKKTKPKRLTMVFVFTVFGFFAGYTFFFIRYKWLKFRQTHSFKFPENF